MRRLGAGLIPWCLRRSQKKPSRTFGHSLLSPGSTIPPSAQAILTYGLAQFGFLSTRVAGEFFTRLTSLAFYVRKSSSACSSLASLPVTFFRFSCSASY